MHNSHTKKGRLDAETLRIAALASLIGAIGLLALWGGIAGVEIGELGTRNALGILTGLFGGLFGGILLAVILG